MKRIIRLAVTLLLTAALTLCYTACALPVGADELTAGYHRTAADVSIPDKSPGRIAYETFAFSLFSASLNDPEAAAPNRMVSPYSAAMCLGMLANGAGGETRAQMEAVLGMPVDDLNAWLYDTGLTLPAGKDATLRLADSVWFRDDASLTVKPAFLQSVADWYNAEVYAAPFDAGTVRDINNWCANKTDGMIDQILDEIPADAALYLVNSLFFESEWEEKYEKKDIAPRTFTNADGTQTTVDMLFSSESRFLSGEGFTGFARPYKGGYCFVGLLPDDGVTAEALAASLTGEVWHTAWTEQTHESVDAGIPEFTFDYGMDMTDTLRALGMTDVFDAASADLSPMAEYAGGSLYCEYVVQKTRVELDRHGTRAAAVTFAAMNTQGMDMSSHTVILDRPFVFVIAESSTGLPLFIGAVGNLS